MSYALIPFDDFINDSTIEQIIAHSHVKFNINHKQDQSISQSHNTHQAEHYSNQ